MTEVYNARKGLVETTGRDWSLAVLVPTKKFMQVVSDVFSEPPAGMTAIRHSSAVDMEGPILSAYVIAYLGPCLVRLQLVRNLLFFWVSGSYFDFRHFAPGEMAFRSASCRLRVEVQPCGRESLGTDRVSAILREMVSDADGQHAWMQIASWEAHPCLILVIDADID